MHTLSSSQQTYYGLALQIREELSFTLAHHLGIIIDTKLGPIGIYEKNFET
jgi:hypothetical protein